MRTAAVIASATLFLLADVSALADPPRWAPAHGYRDKQDDHDRRDDERRDGRDRDGDRDGDHDGDRHGNRRRQSYYVGYSGTEYDRDFGIPAGRCNREEVGAVLGGVVGGVVGNQVGSRDNRVVATILGATVGALIGAKIGRDMDDRDRSCFGHALEIGTGGRRVNWSNNDTGVRYALVPLDGARGGTQVCRDFQLTSSRGGIVDVRKGRACQVRPGAWELVR